MLLGIYLIYLHNFNITNSNSFIHDILLPPDISEMINLRFKVVCLDWEEASAVKIQPLTLRSAESYSRLLLVGI